MSSEAGEIFVILTFQINLTEHGQTAQNTFSLSQWAGLGVITCPWVWACQTGPKQHFQNVFHLLKLRFS